MSWFWFLDMKVISSCWFVFWLIWLEFWKVWWVVVFECKLYRLWIVGGWCVCIFVCSVKFSKWGVVSCSWSLSWMECFICGGWVFWGSEFWCGVVKWCGVELFCCVMKEGVVVGSEIICSFFECRVLIDSSWWYWWWCRCWGWSFWSEWV